MRAFFVAVTLFKELKRNTSYCCLTALILPDIDFHMQEFLFGHSLQTHGKSHPKK